MIRVFILLLISAALLAPQSTTDAYVVNQMPVTSVSVYDQTTGDEEFRAERLTSDEKADLEAAKSIYERTVSRIKQAHGETIPSSSTTITLECATRTHSSVELRNGWALITTTKSSTCGGFTW